MAELFRLIDILFQVYFFMIFAYVLMSWIPGLRESPVGSTLGRLVEPYLSIFRFIPPIGMIDISPIVALIALQFIQRGLYQVLQFLF